MKVEYAGYAGGAYPKKKLLASLPQSSISQKRIAGLKSKQGRLRGRQLLGTFCCCKRKRVNTVEKQ
jgi:hypothetical protein